MDKVPNTIQNFKENSVVETRQRTATKIISLDEDDDRESSLSYQFLSAALRLQDATAPQTGPSNSNWMVRCLWILAYVGLFAVFVLQTITLGQKFQSYPTDVSITIVSEPKMDFPAVTVCNENPIRRSLLQRIRKYQELILLEDYVMNNVYRFAVNANKEALERSDFQIEDCNSTTSFNCSKTAICISKSWLCNGIDNCGDNSDETLPNCEEIAKERKELEADIPEEQGICMTGYIQCPDENICAGKCDDDPECVAHHMYDESVELGCSETQCNETLTATNDAKTLTSPNYDEGAYFNNLNCSWLITAGEGEVVQVKFLDLQVEGEPGNCRDYLMFFDADLSLKVDGQVHVCGFGLPKLVHSSDSEMTVVFVTDEIYTLKGFKLEFNSVSKENITRQKRYIGFEDSFGEYLLPLYKKSDKNGDGATKTRRSSSVKVNLDDESRSQGQETTSNLSRRSLTGLVDQVAEVVDPDGDESGLTDSLQPLSNVDLEPVSDIDLQPVSDIDLQPVNDVDLQPVSDITLQPVNDVDLQPAEEVLVADEIDADYANQDYEISDSPKIAKDEYQQFYGIPKDAFFELMKASILPDYSDFQRAVVFEQKLLIELGHQKEDFIVQCTFNGRECNSNFFTTYQDSAHGNCFSFNSIRHRNLSRPISTLKTSKTGQDFGLKLTLFLDAEEYMGLFAQSTGAKVLINDPMVSGQVKTEGLSVASGEATFIGVRLDRVEREGGKYSNCTDEWPKSLQLKENFKKEWPRYSRERCLEICLTNQMALQCGCIDTFETDITTNEEILEASRTFCEVTNRTLSRCKQKVYLQYSEGELICHCPQACLTLTYTQSMSTSPWPSESYTSFFAAKLITSKSTKVRRYLQNVLASIDNHYQLMEKLKKNFARIEIFFETLNFQSLKEYPAYGITDFLSDFGGNIGLWLGWSVLSMFEVFQFFYECFEILCRPTHHSKYTR